LDTQTFYLLKKSSYFRVYLLQECTSIFTLVMQSRCLTQRHVCTIYFSYFYIFYTAGRRPFWAKTCNYY